jgi:hypothetical protein
MANIMAIAAAPAIKLDLLVMGFLPVGMRRDSRRGLCAPSFPDQ